MQTRHAIKLPQELGRFHDHWTSKVIAEMNDYQFKFVKFAGEW